MFPSGNSGLTSIVNAIMQSKPQKKSTSFWGSLLGSIGGGGGLLSGIGNYLQQRSENNYENEWNANLQSMLPQIFQDISRGTFGRNAGKF